MTFRCIRFASAFLVIATCLRAQAQWLPTDAQGWTSLKPSADTRIHYVSNDGNDATASAHAAGAPVIGSDPFHPVGRVRAFKSVAAAIGAARSGAADWVLLEAGGTWVETLSPKDGRAPGEPFVVGAYGTGHRPVLLNGAEQALRLSPRGFHDIALVGIEFYAHTRDPKSSAFVSPAGKMSILTLRAEGTSARLLVEDCCFRFNFFSMQSRLGAPLHDVALRRNQFLDSYTYGGHAQGVFLSHVTNAVVEENLFDHNGWCEDPKVGKLGKATVFNHNIYVSSMHNFVFRGNLVLRASALGIKFRSDEAGACVNPVVDDNLFVEGEVGISIGGNVDIPDRYVNSAVTNNVFTHIGRSRPTNRTLSLAIDIQGWDGGLVVNNLIAPQALDAVRQTTGILLRGSIRDAVIGDNVIWGLKSTRPLLYVMDDAARSTKVVLESNWVQSQTDANPVLRTPADPSAYTFRNNTYRREGSSPPTIEIGDQQVDIGQWRSRSKDAEPTSRSSPFPDPARTVETYMAKLGQPATFDAFIAEARGQSKSRWLPEYTAATVNDYMRAGFGMKRARPDWTPKPLPAMHPIAPPPARQNTGAAKRANDRTPKKQATKPGSPNPKRSTRRAGDAAKAAGG